jgi:hypothetical protein
MATNALFLIAMTTMFTGALLIALALCQAAGEADNASEEWMSRNDTH